MLRAWSRATEQPRAAIRADPSALDAPAVGNAARDGYRRLPRCGECIVVDHDANGERAARDALAVGAVAGVDIDRCLRDRIADRAADAASRQWQWHGSPAFAVRGAAYAVTADGATAPPTTGLPWNSGQVPSPFGSALPTRKETPMLTLYFAPGSSAMAPHIALHEIGAPFESRPLSFQKKQNRDPAYLAINPEGKVPTLLIDDRPLTEVAAILFYLARRFPNSACCRRTTAKPRRRRCRGCRLSRRQCIRRGARERSMRAASMRWRIGGWVRGNGRWESIRSPTSTCSDCSGGSAAG